MRQSYCLPMRWKYCGVMVRVGNTLVNFRSIVASGQTNATQRNFGDSEKAGFRKNIEYVSIDAWAFSGKIATTLPKSGILVAKKTVIDQKMMLEGYTCEMLIAELNGLGSDIFVGRNLPREKFDFIVEYKTPETVLRSLKSCGFGMVSRKTRLPFYRFPKSEGNASLSVTTNAFV
jgi:hypothetical protein